MRFTYGFTLIELSIVLVIIGLIVGGVLVGRDLIRAAELRATIGQLEKFQTAVNTFRGKYNTLPGDMASSDATALGFQPVSRPLNTSITVHGDGIIEDDGSGFNIWSVNPPIYTGAGRLLSEPALFWQDLSSAELISGGFSSITADTNPYAATQNLNATQLNTFLPTAKIGGVWAISGMRSPNRINYFFLGKIGATTNFSDTSQVSAVLSPSDAYSFDTKIDNGIPDTGRVKASSIYSFNGTFYIINPWFPGGDGGQVCATSSIASGQAIQSQYTVSTGESKVCNLVIEAGF